MGFTTPEHIEEAESEAMKFEEGLLAVGIQAAEVFELLLVGSSFGVLAMSLLSIKVEEMN